MTGELWIGGIQVARGYLHLPELTADKFIPDPFHPGIRTVKVLAEEYSAGDRRLQAYLQVDDGRYPLLGSYQRLLTGNEATPSELHILPNGLPVLSANINEVRFLYKEVF